MMPTALGSKYSGFSYLKHKDGSREIVEVEERKESPKIANDSMPAHNPNRPRGSYIDSKELSNRTKEALSIKSDPDSVNFRKTKKK